VDLWDTAGQEVYEKLHSSFYYGADSAILVFDVTRKSTYKNLETWYTELRQMCPFIPVICVGNKIDLDAKVTQRKFSFPLKYDLPFYFASASSGVNVVRFFNDAIRLAVGDKLNPKDKTMAALLDLIRKQ
jgi:Rab-like protein 2